MSALFSSPSQPPPPPTPPPAPNASNSAADMNVAAQQEALALQRGRSATILTGGGGLPDAGTSSKQLLGQ